MKTPILPLDLLTQVAEHLGLDCDRVVFVGGTTVSLLVVDPAAAASRVTEDVDCIVHVEKLSEYYEFIHRLERSGFSPDQNGPICRYEIGGLKVDISNCSVRPGWSKMSSLSWTTRLEDMGKCLAMSILPNSRISCSYIGVHC